MAAKHLRAGILQLHQITDGFHCLANIRKGHGHGRRIKGRNAGFRQACQHGDCGLVVGVHEIIIERAVLVNVNKAGAEISAVCVDDLIVCLVDLRFRENCMNFGVKKDDVVFQNLRICDDFCIFNELHPSFLLTDFGDFLCNMSSSFR